MPQRDSFDEDWEDPDDESADSEDLETIPCPYCGKQIYEEAERCPACENYISREDAPSRHARWFALGVLVCLGLVAGWIIGC